MEKNNLMKTLQGNFKAFVTAAKNKDPIASTIQQSSRFANKEFWKSFTAFWKSFTAIWKSFTA